LRTLRKQRGVSLSGLIVVGGLLIVVGVVGMKLLPAYIEYFKMKKIFAAMEQAGDIKGSVRDIRSSFDKRNAIEDVGSVKSEDIEISKEGGETVLTVSWSTKVPIVGNASACLDFTVTTAK
jgi:Domain of unknown function (DUF4845)